MSKKVLVVEDNELNCRLFCDLLRVHGYDSEAVRDGREVIERVQLLRPDLIIMDIQMPHISGLDLIQAIKGDVLTRGIPIMAVTAYAAKGDEDRIRAAGAEGYVSKPIALMPFMAEVERLVG